MGNGNSSGGIGGLGGDSACAGFSNGSGDTGTFYELAGSAVNGAFLDNSPTGLIHGNGDGRYIFSARNGTVRSDPRRSGAGKPW